MTHSFVVGVLDLTLSFKMPVNIPVAVLANMKVFKDALDYAGVAGEDEDASTFRGALLRTLAAPASLPLAVLGSMDPEDLKTRMESSLIQTEQVARPLSVVEKGQVMLLIRVARLATGADFNREPPPAVTAPVSALAGASHQAAAVAAIIGRKVRLDHILSQIDETEVPITDKHALKYRLRYQAAFGKLKDVPENKEPNEAQMAALEYLLEILANPYVDFAVWGPFQHRIGRKLKLRRKIFSAPGTYRVEEIPGPPDVMSWKRSYQVMKIAYVMLELVDLGILDAYMDRITEAWDQYGEELWCLLCQADVRFRLELAYKCLK